jgi:hypothetical protein
MTFRIEGMARGFLSSEVIRFVIIWWREMILLSILKLAQRKEPHVQIRRYKKNREEETAENSQRKEAGQTGKEEEQIAGQHPVCRWRGAMRNRPCCPGLSLGGCPKMGSWPFFVIPATVEPFRPTRS